MFLQTIKRKQKPGYNFTQVDTKTFFNYFFMKHIMRTRKKKSSVHFSSALSPSVTGQHLSSPVNMTSSPLAARRKWRYNIRLQDCGVIPSKPGDAKIGDKSGIGG